MTVFYGYMNAGFFFVHSCLVSALRIFLSETIQLSEYTELACRHRLPLLL